VAAGRFPVLLCLFGVLVLPRCAAAKHISIDTGECSGDMSAAETVIKSETIVSKVGGFRAFGELAYRRNAGGDKKNQCHVEYRLFVSIRTSPFELVKARTSETEDGEIAGIDLIGASPDGSKLAADSWSAEGDGEEHWPIVYDFRKKQVWDRSLADIIQVRIHGCDQVEDFVGVSNTGEAVFAVPPSIYDDSSGCGDKGLWHFNLQTARVYRVARISGEKWR
jgi:hypothetical protein